VTEGRLTHLLMQARQLTEGRPDLALADHFICAALRIVRRIHRG